mmetsp:Transcript_16812/g.46986  ORF Transcript_16812/g.46986 Transcript_16812/m.46986 type:complete len:638 (-) Transcript_16812:1282-3195(-)
MAASAAVGLSSCQRASGLEAREPHRHQLTSSRVPVATWRTLVSSTACLGLHQGVNLVSVRPFSDVGRFPTAAATVPERAATEREGTAPGRQKRSSGRRGAAPRDGKENGTGPRAKKNVRGGGKGISEGGRFRVDVKVPWRNDAGKDIYEITPDLAKATAQRMGLKDAAALPVGAMTIVRKSFDARKVNDKVWVYVVDVEAAAATSANGGKRPRTRPGRCEWVRAEEAKPQHGGDKVATQGDNNKPKRVVIVGSGPAGLFAAISLAEAGHQVVVLERGKAVEDRGRDIGALFVRRKLDEDSNLCYGEGGAGTWSDGKLTTRIGRNSDPVRRVLNYLHEFGAPESVLMAGKPHLGTDRLVRILQGCRRYLQDNGAEIRFDTKVEEVVIEDGNVKGVKLVGSGPQGETIPADHVVLAVGHSARALYQQLAQAGVQLESKPFAMGFRIEHPQAVIDTIQYGEEDASVVQRGSGPIPVADYKLTATVQSEEEAVAELHSELRQSAWEAAGEDWQRGSPAEWGSGSRAVYSFCMCPGGQVVPTSTHPDYLCVNGMSFSRRNSRWANSALVVGIIPEDWAPWEPEWGALAGVKLQESIESRAAKMGGGDLVAPVQVGPPSPCCHVNPTLGLLTAGVPRCRPEGR